jgi:carbon-monoxide dehydrogenase large subunit
VPAHGSPAPTGTAAVERAGNALNTAHAHIGKALERIEDARFLTGRGCYVDDLAPAGLLHAAVFRSAYAHGRIRALDVAAARVMPGVAAVYTAADLGGAVPCIPLRMEPRPELARFVQGVIAQGKVRYVGEPLALVIADSAARAEDAANAIVADIEPLPPVAGTQDALSGALFLFEEHATNHAMTLSGVRGDADAAFREAAYTRRETFRVQRHTAVPLETRGLLATWRDGRLTAYGAMKVPFAVRALLATLLELPESAVDVIENDAGAGFGVRGEFYPEDFWVAFAARALARPVKWIEDRREHLAATSHARETECELEIACARDGTLLALRGRAFCDMGAYLRPNAVTAPRNLAQMIMGPYRVPNVKMDVAMVLSNKTPAGSYRGPGRFEADFCRERLFDIAARELGIERVEFRRRNLLAAAEIPCALPTVLPYNSGGEFDSGDYHATLARCLEEFGWREKSALQGKLVDGRYHGLGVGCYVEGGATGPRENARIVYVPDGRLEIYVGSSAIGQGLETVFTQIAAEALGVPLTRIRGVFHGSTTHVREGFGSWASRGSVMGGSAIVDAAANLRRAIRAAAATQFGCAPEDIEFADELTTVRSAGKSRSIGELSPDGFAAEGCFVNARRTYSYGAHAAHVTVDAATGKVEVVAYAAVEDVGRILNPHTLHGQVLGAITQGLGASLHEHLRYDADAQLQTGSLADYLLPNARDFPFIHAIALEDHPSPIGPLGAKGAGEGGIIPVGGVIANAVASALSSLAVEPRALPLTPARTWQLIQAARQQAAA